MKKTILVSVCCLIFAHSPLHSQSVQKVFVQGGAMSLSGASTSVNSFSISKFEITNSQYASFLNGMKVAGDGMFKGVLLINISSPDLQLVYFNGRWKPKQGKEQYPMVMVNYWGAVACSRWMGGRLPSESEWIFAARAGSKNSTAVFAGGDRLSDVGWYKANSQGHSHPVGRKRPNGLGLYDMSGNVWEWCLNDTVKDNSGFCVHKGGSWYADEQPARTDAHYGNTPDHFSNSVGFRVLFEARSIAHRVDSVMALLSVDEKIGQINQLSGRGAVTGPFGPEDQYYIESVRAGEVGSLLNVTGAETTRKVQKIAVEETRMKIPLLFGFDVIHGYKTIFPMPLGEASSWDPALAEQTSRVAAVEASAAGIHWTFAPMVDICRDPRWGRIFEGHGEDPFLGSAFARAKVKGFQGDDLSKNNTIAACVKHFAAYGAAIGGRDYNGVDLSERVLRETYFPPYKAAVDAGAVTAMASFNDVNGIPATASEWLMQQVLRSEWGFTGFVVSDYMGITEMLNHRVAKDTTDAAYLAFKAGVDMDMMGRAYVKKMKSLIAHGAISMEQLDRSVRAILTVKFQLGLFDDPYRYCSEEREKEVTLSPGHRALAREAARQSLVLLKNDSTILPLSKNVKTIAVIGPLSDSQSDMMSSWAFKGDPKDVVTLLAGIRSKVTNGTNVLFAKGCDIDSDSRTGFDEALAAAAKADVVVMALGESKMMSGEGLSKAEIGLPGVQQELLKAINTLGKPLVVVLFNGRPLTLSWEQKHCPTILEAWLPGTEGGHAIADVLFGDFNPSGKLTVSFPYSVGQIPIYYASKSTGRPAKPNQRYTSKYSDIQIDPLFEFGYGLSYSKFAYSVPVLSRNTLRLSEGTAPLPAGNAKELTVSVDVTNTSSVDGTEIVQLYIEDMCASVTLPVRELKGFEKRRIATGKTETVQFRINVDDLKFYDKDMNFIAEPGKFRVYVGGSSHTQNAAEFELTP